jgi:hypothetical protein
MRPSFTDVRGLRKALCALGVLAACAAAAPDALAQEGAGVIVASSSPSNAVGRVVAAGETLRLERGAAVSVLDESGRVATIVRTGAYRPAAAPQTRRSGASPSSSLVNNLGEERTCAAANAEATPEGLERALVAGCDAVVVALLDRLVDRAGPPQLYVALVHSRGPGGRAIGIEAQTNFEAFLYCRLRRADAALVAITPEAGALPMRVLASNRYEFNFPSPGGEASGAVQCMAIGASPGGAAPEIGDWPRELDPQRAREGARVAASLLPIETH